MPATPTAARNRRTSRWWWTTSRQIAGGEGRIIGVMMESHLVGGRQDVVPGADLTYGQSITDGCIDWQTTVPALNLLADAVAARREARGGKLRELTA